MNNIRIKRIEDQIQYVVDNPHKYKNPELILEGLNNLLLKLS